jgi:23S rRNA (cytidine2498-2'-O)-methyltransferase
VTDFAFATCLPGLEAALKLDVGRVRPDLRFAYSRPGLVTFKTDGAIRPDEPPGSVFARVWGRSIGPATVEDAGRQLADLGTTRVHVFLRAHDEQQRGGDPQAGGGEARDTRDKGHDENALATWRTALGGMPSGPAEEGDLVGDVIVAAGDEKAWLGVHRHSNKTHLKWPGGEIPVEVPSDAPSRAFAKIEEAIEWAQLPMERGHVALEIGAAPGGAVMALAQRGLEVWGVDTGDLAPNVKAMKGVHHLPMKVGALRWEQLPPRVDWLLVDVNLAPQVAVHEVARLMPKLKATLRGCVFTLKLNELSFVAELPVLAERIRAFGFADVRMRHLPSNRREICCVALRG